MVKSYSEFFGSTSPRAIINRAFFRPPLINCVSFYSSTCHENYIEVYDNLDCTGYRVARICRASDFTLYYSFMNTACVRYHSSSPSDSHELTGFEMAFTPVDVDECRWFGDILCENSCTNIPGDFYCNCLEGYFLAADGRTCFGELVPPPQPPPGPPAPLAWPSRNCVAMVI